MAQNLTAPTGDWIGDWKRRFAGKTVGEIRAADPSFSYGSGGNQYDNLVMGIFGDAQRSIFYDPNDPTKGGWGNQQTPNAQGGWNSQFQTPNSPMQQSPITSPTNNQFSGSVPMQYKPPGPQGPSPIVQQYRKPRRLSYGMLRSSYGV